MNSSIKKDEAEIMNRARKFLFDTNDFSEPEVEEEQAPPPPSFSQEELDQTRAQAYDEGLAEGLRLAKEKQEEHIARALDQALDQIQSLAQAEDRREISKCRDAVRLSLRMLHKILPQFARSVALMEMERVIADGLEQRHDEPRMTISVHASMVQEITARIEKLTHEKGYTGRIVLLADDTLSETDCRIEWAEGGAERIFDLLVGRVESELTKAVDSLSVIEETKN